jgi:transcriptional antiterminator RfaH
VLRIVSFANRPAPIDDEVITHIKNSMDKVAEQGGIKPGQTIELDDGPFKGINAIFQSYDGEERAIVLVTFMQKQQQVRVPVSAIRS